MFDPVIVNIFSSSNSVALSPAKTSAEITNLLAAYRTALNEPLLAQDVRIMLRRHFNNLLHLFLQIKLLDIVR